MHECALPECSVTFTPSYKGRKFCSHDCANKSGRGGTRRPEQQCEICGQMFKPHVKPSSGYAQRTCGRACGAELQWSERRARQATGPSLPVWFRECEHCRSLFAARRAKQVTCSADCSRRLSWAKSNAARHASEHICACGAVILPSRKKCDVCLIADRKLRRQRERRAERARKRGVKREPYTLDEIAMRDRNRCGLCGKRVSMNLTVPHLKAPTIDHVMPLAKGGDDTRANVQLAHFSCNARKHTGGSQQLALIG